MTHISNTRIKEDNIYVEYCPYKPLGTSIVKETAKDANIRLTGYLSYLGLKTGVFTFKVEVDTFYETFLKGLQYKLYNIPEPVKNIGFMWRYGVSQFENPDTESVYSYIGDAHPPMYNYIQSLIIAHSILYEYKFPKLFKSELHLTITNKKDIDVISSLAYFTSYKIGKKLESKNKSPVKFRNCAKRGFNKLQDLDIRKFKHIPDAFSNMTEIYHKAINITV